MNTIHSPQFLKNRRFYLMLPLIVIPFLVLLFWILGGGRADAGNAVIPVMATGGLNTELPAAHNTEHTGWTKLDYYKQADADSAKRRAAIARDPYYDLPALLPDGSDGVHLLLLDQKKKNMDLGEQEQQVEQQLFRLNAQLQAKPVKKSQPVKKFEPAVVAVSADVRRLEQMMRVMRQPDSSSDPEMQQISGMLDKLIDVRHPDRMEEKSLSELTKRKNESYTVALPKENAVGILEPEQIDTAGNAFYPLENSPASTLSENSIPAVVAETQTLVSGATIKLRLQQQVLINAIPIPTDQFVYGLVQLSGDRLLVSIQSVRTGSTILPVQLSAYDQDGLPGLYIPGAIWRNVLKQSSNQSVSSLRAGSFNPSVGAQAASAGIQAVKTLLSHHIRQIKVTVNAGYRIFLH